ncbi:MAG: response regulator [Gammaproteobacteria bacterium]|nr:response regulator [Gammaproteobacteria bacterium]
MTDEATVFVVDDDDAVRDSVMLLLKSAGLATEGYGDGQSFLDAVDAKRAGCIVLDVRMPGMSGLDLQKKLNELGSTLPIVFVTGHGDVPMAVEAMRAGAEEFLQKPFRDQDLLDRVHTALQRDQDNRAVNIQRHDVQDRVAQLTAREREVFEQLVNGESTKQIAAAFALSPRTVEIHRSRVLEKMGVRSVAELVKLALAGGG